MKKIMITIAWLLAAFPAAFAQTAYLESVKVANRRVEKVGGEVRVQMDICLDDLQMKNQHSLQLVPVILSEDGSLEQPLEPLYVDGRIRSKVLKRKAALEDWQTDGERLRRRNGQTQTMHYEAAAPYEPWMLNGRLELRADVTGCAECGEGHETLTTGGILPYREPEYEMAVVQQPKEEVVKRRSEVRTARLQYRQDSYRVLPKYKNNQQELDKVQASIDAVKQDANLTITGIYITGYASPEATVAYNLALSERRAKTFTDYIRQRNPELDASLWHVDWKGEDWDGLRKVVEQYPNLLKQDEVLDIIDHCGDDKDACEEQIKALIPPEIYQRVLNEMYPAIRRNEYRIEYNVRHFDLKEGKQMIKTRPDLMSVSEMQRVADSYGKGTPQYTDCLLTAARTYPDNVTAVNNAALALIEAGRAQEAVNMLEKAPRDGALLNMLGTAYAETGQTERAMETFRRAADAGYAPAADNAALLQKYTEYMAE